MEIKISGADKSKISTLPPTLLSTTTKKTGTSVVTTSKVVKGSTIKNHLKSINSTKSKSSTGEFVFSHYLTLKKKEKEYYEKVC